MSGPLSGIRVIDLTQALAGPYGTMLLADLGADVIKVEAPSGDMTRGVGPYLDDDEDRTVGGYFHSINRGKRSIVLDLKTEEGRRDLLALVADAHVLAENFSLGVMERLGLPWPVIHDANPRLVYAATRGYGDPLTGESPYSSWPAVDVVIQAVGGIMGITGTEDGTPIKVGPGIGDIFPGTLMALGILAGVLHARETGEGQYLDVAMYDSILSLCERIVYQYSYQGEVAVPEGNKHPFLSPFDVLPAKDGWVTIAAPIPARWSRLCILIGRPELIQDERYATNYLRAQRRDEVRQILIEWTSVRTRAEIVTTLGGEVPVGAVNTAADVFADPHVAARQMVLEAPHPHSARTVAIAGQPIKFAGTPVAVDTHAPLLDEHGAEIRAEIQRAARRPEPTR